MLGVRYIALVARIAIGEDRRPRRDENGKLETDGYMLHHNRLLYETASAARTQANRSVYGVREDSGRVLRVDLDDLLSVDATPDERFQHAERRMLSCLGEMTIGNDVSHGRDVDKSDQDYAARGARTAALKERAAVEVARLLEAFRPPRFMIETRRNVGAVRSDRPSGHGLEHDTLMADPNAWFAVIKDPNPEGSDAHIYVIARTEQGALAKLLAHIVDGGGFYPMT